MRQFNMAAPLEKLVSLGSQISPILTVGTKNVPVFLLTVHFSSVTMPNRRTSEPTAKRMLETLGPFPYNPDLAISDSCLCPTLEKHLSGHHFTCDEDVKRASIKWLT